MSAAGGAALDVAGFWALWHQLHVGERTETTVDRLRELGIPRSTAYRHLATFRAVTGATWPHEIAGAELVEVLRRRGQGRLFA